MRVLVCGGRDFSNNTVLWRVLNEIHAATPITLIINGAARGADKLSSSWAESHSVSVHEHPADWDKYRKSAGPIRNSAMLKEWPDLVVAFPGGTGTADMVRKAKSQGVEVREIDSLF